MNQKACIDHEPPLIFNFNQETKVSHHVSQVLCMTGAWYITKNTIKKLQKTLQKKNYKKHYKKKITKNLQKTLQKQLQKNYKKITKNKITKKKKLQKNYKKHDWCMVHYKKYNYFQRNV